VRWLYLAVAWLAAVASVFADDAPPYADHYRAAVSAYQAGDADAFLQAARGARALRPDSPQAAYLLAAALSTNGQAEESLALLETLANQGLRFEPAAEPAFAGLDLAAQAPGLLEKFRVNGQPAGAAETIFTLDDGRFVPEGLAWDAKRERFLLGSVHQRRVVSVFGDGRREDFLPPGHGGLLSVFGMQIDPATDSLWLATSGLRESGDIGAEWLGRAGILQFDLATGALRRSFWLAPDHREHVLGDLQLLPDGDVLATDSVTGEMLRLDTASAAFDVLVPGGQLVSPQGLVLDEAAKLAWVADYRGGLFRVRLSDGELEKVAEDGTSHHGIDGLYRYGHWLVAIQNGIQPNRVVALALDSSGLKVTRYEVLASALPEFDDPNLGVIVDDRLYFNANSHWPRFDRDGRLPDGLSGPVVLAVGLPAVD
jgi:sugar lactone lactonase YvrE